MTVTRLQLRTNIQQRGDFATSARWGNAEIDATASYVHWREWKRLLNANRHYRLNKVQPTTASDGRIALTALTTGAGDNVKNFYRVVTFIRNNYVYKFGTVEEWALGEAQGVAPRVYYLEGQNLMFLPKETSFNFASDPNGSFIWVNWYPQRVDGLSADNVAVDFPDGYEALLELEAAAMLLSKGGAEIDTTAQFKALAETMRQDLLQDVARVRTQAMRAQFEDTAAMWAGN